MKLYKTSDPQAKPSIVMLVYGQGGVGKSTFASTAPKPIMADCENGAKYFGLRGIQLDVALIESWADMRPFYDMVKKSDYETVVIDPIGELMEKLKAFMIAQNDRKLVQQDGSPSMAGWGWLKEKMREFVKAIRDLNRHMIIVAHVEEKDDEGRMVKRPKIMTKISEDLIALVDVVGFMDVVTVEGQIKRIIRVQPSEKFEAKDRTNQLGPIIEPEFTKIISACQGTEVFAWSKPGARTAPPPVVPPAAPKKGKKAPKPTKTTKPGKQKKEVPPPAKPDDGVIRCSAPRCGNELTPQEAEYSRKMFEGTVFCRPCQEEINSLA